MTELEKAKLLASLIGHNERMTQFGESTILVPNYTAALRLALGCMNRVHGIDDPLLKAMENDGELDHPANSMISLRTLRGYHSVGAMRQFAVDGWPDGEDCYLETIEEAMRCVVNRQRGAALDSGMIQETVNRTDGGTLCTSGRRTDRRSH